MVASAALAAAVILAVNGDGFARWIVTAILAIVFEVIRSLEKRVGSLEQKIAELEEKQ